MNRRKQALANLDREINDHIEQDTQDNIARGMTPEEARHAALCAFGNIGLVKEETRAVWTPIWLDQILQDARYGLRMLRRNPGFSVVVILTLALGIGMNTAVFSVFNTVLLRPLQYPNPERLIWLSMQGLPGPFMRETLATADFAEWREQATSFEHLVAYGASDQSVAAGNDVARARIMYVSEGFWEISGARPVLGRLPQIDERNTLLLSHKFFERWLHSDPTIVGRTVTVEGQPAMIVGVLPKSFLFQLSVPSVPGFDASKDIDAYRPKILSPQDRDHSRPSAANTSVVAKLKPGVSIDRARTELEVIRDRVRQANPKWFTNQAKLHVIPLREKLVGDARQTLWVLMGAVAFVLLIACANIANLLLARSSTRQREIAIRASLGAGRTRVLRQFLVECALFALLGGAAGLLFARWGLAMVLQLIPQAVPRLTETTIDARVLAFAMSASLFTAFLFGLSPAISLWNVKVYDLLKDGARTFSASSRSLQIRRFLVAAELALAVVLLSGAGLLMKSFWRMNARPAGFDPESILVMRLQFSGLQYREMAQQRIYVDELLHKVQSIPGVQTSSITSPDARISIRDFVEGVPDPSGIPPPAVFNATSAGYARVMGLRLLKGRWITDAEQAPVVVVNESLERNHFDGRNPLGMRVRLPVRPPSYATVVGVVADLKYSKLDAKPEPELYIPYAHTPALGRMTVTVRTMGDPLVAAPSILKVISSIDKTQAVFDVETMAEAEADSIAPRRFNLFLLGIFATTALLLALIGIYGVIAYSVAQRTHEIGIRMALGAQGGEVVRMIVRQGIGIALAGIIIGLAAAFAITRLMGSLLYDVEPTDTETFAFVAVALGITSFIAALGPALKAALVDPINALRYE
jgi:predicted permease